MQIIVFCERNCLRKALRPSGILCRLILLHSERTALRQFTFTIRLLILPDQFGRTQLIMSPTFSKAGKHSIYLKEDVFYRKLMLLNREKNTLKKKQCILKLGPHYIQVQFQAPEAAHTLEVFFEKYAFSFIHRLYG